MPESPWISIMLRHRGELNLSTEQVATLEQLRSDFKSQVAPRQQELHNTEREIARLLQETPVDLVQVKAKIEGAEKLRAEFRYLRIETLLNGRSVLTAEQQEKLKTLVSSSQRRRFHGPRGQAS